MYLIFKTLHLTFAIISITGFLVRSILMFYDSPLLQNKWVQLTPHLVDTVFLLSGFSMAFMVNFGLFSQLWLTAKIFLLMFYLLFVGIALSRGTTKTVRVGAFFAALFTFAFIVGIAINKSPLGWFAPLL